LLTWFCRFLPSPPVLPQGLADVVREIARNKRARGFPGRSAEELLAEEESRLAENQERDNCGIGITRLRCAAPAHDVPR
jgi:hypothetical protein